MKKNDREWEGERDGEKKYRERRDRYKNRKKGKKESAPQIIGKIEIKIYKEEREKIWQRDRKNYKKWKKDW